MIMNMRDTTKTEGSMTKKERGMLVYLINNGLTNIQTKEEEDIDKYDRDCIEYAKKLLGLL